MRYLIEVVLKIKFLKFKLNLSIIMVIIFGDFLMLYQVFLSQHVKRGVIISNKHGI